MLKNDGIYLNKTCAHFGKFDLIDEKMKKIGTYQSLYDSDLHEAFKPHHMIKQEELPDELLLNDGVKVIGEQLGAGGFGTAFKCQFRGENYVIKLPNNLLKYKLLYFNKNGFLRRKSDHPDYGGLMELSLSSFEEECEFNEMALDPASHREIRNHEAGSNIKHANHTQFMKIKNELDHMKRHEGYDHIHKILGFFSGFPAIFSEPCSGSLQSLVMEANNDIFKGGFGSKLSFQWLDMVRQIGSAIEYLHDIPHIAHLDIKPGNILYIETQDEDGNSVFNWKLSDFGWMVDDSGLGYQTTDLKGTPQFLPRILREMAKNFTIIHYDAYECSLHCFMATIIMCINFDISQGEDGYLFKNSINFNNPSKKDFDVVDCVNESHIIFNMFEAYAKFAVGEDGEDGEMFNSGRDHPLEMLSRMFFSDLSKKPDHFVNLMGAIRLELRLRKNQFPESRGRCVVMPNYHHSGKHPGDLFSDNISMNFHGDAFPPTVSGFNPNLSPSDLLSGARNGPVSGFDPNLSPSDLLPGARNGLSGARNGNSPHSSPLVMSHGSKNVPSYQRFSEENSGYYPQSSPFGMSHASRNGPSYQRFSPDDPDNHPLAVSLNHAKRNLSEHDKSQKFGRHN